MDPITGIGLAASLVTLVGLATQGCTKLHELQIRFKNAPKDLHQLVTDSEILKILLGEIEKTSSDIGSAALSPELRSIWRSNECQMRKDLARFMELIKKLQLQVDGGSRIRQLGRMRFAVSDKQILKCRMAFRSHIEMLNFVQSLLTSRQISQVHTALGVTELRIVEMLDSGLGLIEEEVSAIQRTLSKPQISTTLVERELLSVLTHTHGTFEAKTETYLNLRPTRRGHKLVYWKWAMYQLPIGTLTTEFSHSGPKSEEHGPNGNHDYKVTFKFQPPAWITQVVCQISYVLNVENLGHKLPYWQRTQCGDASLIPKELLSYMRDDDFLAAASCLSSMSSWDIQELCWRGAFYDIFGDITWRLISHFELMNTGQPNSHQELTIDFNDFERPSKLRYPKIHISYRGTVLVTKENSSKAHHQAFCKMSSTYRVFDHTWDKNDSFDSTRQLLADCSGSAIELPTFCNSISQRGAKRFKQHIAQHLDPLCCSEISEMDRWWIGALLHSEPSLKSYLSSHFASFRSPGAFITPESSLPAGLLYENIVHEVLAAPEPKQRAFVMFLCAFGTDSMLDPFLTKANEAPNNFASRDFLRVAVISRNVQTYDSFCDVMDENGLAKEALDLELLMDFVNWDFLGDDDCFIDDLLQGIPPTSTQNDNPSSLLYQYALTLGQESSRYAMKRLLQCGHACYCHPPYARDHFLGPEVLKIAMSSLKEKEIEALETLLDLGASVDFVDPDRYKPSLTALEAVIYQGNSDALRVILNRIDCMSQPEVSLLAALKQAEDYVTQKHPRPVSITVLKTDQSQPCYQISTHSVPAKSDTGCWLSIIISVAKLSYLSEAECISRIEALERICDGDSLSDSDKDSDSELGSDAHYESSDSSSDQISDDDSYTGQDVQMYEQPQLQAETPLDSKTAGQAPEPYTDFVVVYEPELKSKTDKPLERSHTRTPRRQKGVVRGNPLKEWISDVEFWLLDRYNRVAVMSFLDVALVIFGVVVFAQFLVELALWNMGKGMLRIIRYRRALILFVLSLTGASFCRFFWV
ncbi:hypothetical protein ONS96_007575 [Cadophora gregata f. sp. sojae]|nr:hypothetical protein ONS96_007575 [Cadophora gregata f. sp. sojae]